MRRTLLILLACLSLPPTAHAAGGQHPATQPLTLIHPDWPPTLLPAINHPTRIAGHWVNANDEFFYAGPPATFHAFLNLLTATHLPLTIFLHDTPTRRSLLWGDQPPLPYDWSLLVANPAWSDPQWSLPPATTQSPYVLRLDLYLDNIKLEDLHLPPNLSLRSTHDLDTFIKTYNTPHPTTAPSK